MVRIHLFLAGFVYLFFLLGIMVPGIADSDYPNRGCSSKLKRIEILFPTYRLGCWLGKPIGE